VRFSRRLALALLAGALALAAAGLALADDGKGKHGRDDDRNGSTLLRSTLAPSVPTDPTFHGVAAAGAPWVLGRGSVRLRSDGELELEVRGLVLTATGNAGGVTTITASLFCGADSTTTAAATTAAVPLSQAGDAEIDAKVTLPTTCLAPIVFVHPNGAAARYIAVSGWKS
jgi:hypothetical protein